MAYAEKALVRVAQTPVAAVRVLTLWLYATADAVATVETAGYFNSARARLTKGDQIDASMVIDGSVVAKKYCVTAVPASGDVTIAEQTVTHPE